MDPMGRENEFSELCWRRAEDAEATTMLSRSGWAEVPRRCQAELRWDLEDSAVWSPVDRKIHRGNHPSYMS